MKKFQVLVLLQLKKFIKFVFMFFDRIHHGKRGVIYMKITSVADTWNSARRNKDVWRKD